MYFITYVSDLDYAYNPQTKEFDLPSVEWSDCYGKHWQTFESEEARTKALDENERINNQPHIKAQIEAERKEDDIFFYMSEVDYYLNWKMENSKRVEFSEAMSIRSHFNIVDEKQVRMSNSQNEAYLLENLPHVHKAIKEAVLSHNKALMGASHVKPTTYALGELF